MISPQTINDLGNLYQRCKMWIGVRERAGWSRNIGAGWLKEDISELIPNGSVDLWILFQDSRRQRIPLDQMNLRELDAIKTWLEEWHEKSLIKPNNQP